MKMKNVCDLTGLTARAVRLYMDENLIQPQFTENYLGRRSFEFSEIDVKKLRDIAVLRKFGFSIDEIRKIDQSKENSTAIIADICVRKKSVLEDEAQTLSILSKLNTGQEYSMEEIAVKLMDFSENKSLPREDDKSRFRYLLKHPVKLVLAILGALDAILLLVVVGFWLFNAWHLVGQWKYPHFTSVIGGVLCLIVALLPAILIPVSWLLIKRIAKRHIPGIGVAGFAVSIILVLPIIVVMIIAPIESYTTDINHYGEIDEYVIYDDAFYLELFPDYPTSRKLVNDEFIYPDSNYYYRCRAAFDFTMDVYSEWSLDKEAFEEEVERVKRLYHAVEGYDGEASDYQYVSEKRGNYTCLIRYKGSPPFDEVKKSYCYYIFAYDEVNMRVRYIVCYSKENGSEQPYYLSLDWVE